MSQEMFTCLSKYINFLSSFFAYQRLLLFAIPSISLTKPHKRLGMLSCFESKEKANNCITRNSTTIKRMNRKSPLTQKSRNEKDEFLLNSHQYRES